MPLKGTQFLLHMWYPWRYSCYKPGDELRFLWRVISFCSTCDTRGVTLVTNPGMNSGASEGQSVSAPHVVPVVLLLLQTRGLTQVPLKVYQFLLHMWYPSCYSCYKPGNDLMCLWRVISFCSTCGTRGVTLVANPGISHEWGKEQIVNTTNRTYPWSFVTPLFRNG